MTDNTPHSIQRRSLLKGAAAAAVAAPIAAHAAAPASSDPWRKARQIVDSFARTPGFPKRDFVVTSFGAKPSALTKVTALIEIKRPVSLSVPAPGSPDCYPAIRAAIAAAHKAGGGRVVIPAGHWYCKGPIVLLSNVNVHLAAGAHVHFSANPADYARDGDFDCGPNGKLVLSRWQGNDCLNFCPMVYARGQRNIAITGEDWTSILDGQAGVPFEDGSGSSWWGMNPAGAAPGALHQAVSNPANAESVAAVAPHLDAATQALIQGTRPDWRSDSRFLPILSEAGVPPERRVFGLGHTLRPCMIEFVDCTDVLMQGYQVINTPFWIHHPINCRKVRMSKVRMESLGPNSDGFDPESCDTVMVDGCLFNTGDDCIAIKSGKNLDTQYGPTRNVVIQDCIMNCGHGGVTLGSEMAAGIEHVYAERIEFRNAYWDYDPLGIAIRLKTNMNRGGFLRHLYVRDVTLPNGVKTTGGRYRAMPGSALAGKAAYPGGGGVITFDCDYAPTDDSVRTRPPEVSDIHISNVRVKNVKTADGEFSCFQAIVLMGPVHTSFNGKPGTPILPIKRVSVTDCDFGNPRHNEPWFVYNAKDVKLKNIRIAGKVFNADIDA